MTQVGHCLTGAAIGVLSAPSPLSRTGWTWRLGGFALLANIPDLSLPGWGHSRYGISHSLFVNLLLMAALAGVLALLPRVRASLGGWHALMYGSVAWLSHLLLDTFYSHGHGLAMFWPLSAARLALPVPWFHTIHAGESALSPANLRVHLVELAAYAPLALAAAAIRGVRRTREGCDLGNGR